MQYITGSKSSLGAKIIDDNDQDQLHLNDDNIVAGSESKLSISDMNDGENIVVLLNEQTYRLAIYAMSLWFWITSGVTYFGVVIADEHDLPNTVKILFYIILCAISLMIMGVVSTAMPTQLKCIKYSSGLMWLLSGLAMIAVVIWEFHINYNDPDWKADHPINNYSPTLYFMATFANYLPVISLAIIISAEIIYDYGAKHIFLNILLFSLIIFITSILWSIPLYRQYQDKNVTITIILKISYVMIAFSSFIIFIIFLFIHKLQNVYCIKYVIIICLLLLNTFSVFTQTFCANGNQFSIFEQEPSGHLHSNFVWLMYITFLCYMVLIVTSSVFSKDLSKQTGLIIHENINNDSFLRFSMNVDLHSLDLNLDCDELKEDNPSENEDINLNNKQDENVLNDKFHRFGLYCLCLWYWIIPDLLTFIMIPQHQLTNSGKWATNLMIAAFIMDIISILGVINIFMFNLNKKCFKIIISVCFIIGSLLMMMSRMFTFDDQCKNSLISNKERNYCGIAQITTYLIGILLPIYISIDLIFDLKQFIRILSGLFILLSISILWSFVIYRYDIDVDPQDIIDTQHHKFRKDIEFVVRMSWMILNISTIIIIILIIINKFIKKVKLWIIGVFSLLFLLSSGMSVIDDYGGEINTNILRNQPYGYPIWSAAFPVNSYWTLYVFGIAVIYDVLNVL